jgi:hypothetical protein
MNFLPNPEDFRWIFPSGGAKSLEQEGIFPKMGESYGPKQQRLGVVKIGWA